MFMMPVWVEERREAGVGGGGQERSNEGGGEARSQRAHPPLSAVPSCSSIAAVDPPPQGRQNHFPSKLKWSRMLRSSPPMSPSCPLSVGKL